MENLATKSTGNSGCDYSRWKIWCETNKKTFEAKKLKQNEAKNQCLKKQSESKRAKGSETKRKFSFLVSQNQAKRKRNSFCFALFRFEAKKNKKRKWDTLVLNMILHYNTIFYVTCSAFYLWGIKIQILNLFSVPFLHLKCLSKSWYF